MRSDAKVVEDIARAIKKLDNENKTPIKIRDICLEANITPRDVLIWSDVIVSIMDSLNVD